MKCCTEQNIVKKMENAKCADVEQTFRQQVAANIKCPAHHFDPKHLNCCNLCQEHHKRYHYKVRHVHHRCYEQNYYCNAQCHFCHDQSQIFQDAECLQQTQLKNQKHHVKLFKDSEKNRYHHNYNQMVQIALLPQFDVVNKMVCCHKQTDNLQGKDALMVECYYYYCIELHNCYDVQIIKIIRAKQWMD